MLKALVVDDERTTRDVLVKHLPWTSLEITEVTVADDGLQAFKIALDFKPDIILSDIRMPKMNGIEMAENIRRKLPDCRFIFLSGYSDKEYLKSAIRLKAVSYVEKPINLEEIAEALKQASLEVKQARETSLTSQPMLLQKMCLSLTNTPPQGHIRCEDIQIPEFELPENSSYVSTLFWLCLSKEGMVVDYSKLEEIVHPMIKNKFQPFEGRYLTAFKGDEYFMIHGKLDDQKNHSLFIELIYQLRLEILAACKEVKNVFAGVGWEVTGIENIYKSYQSAVIALKKCFFSGSVELASNDDHPPYVFNDLFLSAFSDALKNGRMDEATIFIKRLENDLQKCKNTHTDYIKNICTNLFMIMVRFSEDHNILPLKNNYSPLLDQITQAPTLKEIIRCLVSAIQIISRELDENNKDIDIISKVTSYIHKNFYDKELSIQSIAGSLCLTPNYLCLLFKKETGKTINQYITEVRIEHAKRFLKSPSNKLFHVANQVGFNDAKYFSKVFEKSVGLKPKEYREKQCNETNNK